MIQAASPTTCADLHEERLGELAAQLGGPEVAATRRCDVREERDVEALVAAAEEAFAQPLGIMVSNAGGPLCSVAPPGRGACKRTGWPTERAVLRLVASPGRAAGPTRPRPAPRCAAGIVGKTLSPEARMELMDFEGQFDQEVQVGAPGGGFPAASAAPAAPAATCCRPAPWVHCGPRDGLLFSQSEPAQLPLLRFSAPALRPDQPARHGPVHQVRRAGHEGCWPRRLHHQRETTWPVRHRRLLSPAVAMSRRCPRYSSQCCCMSPSQLLSLFALCRSPLLPPSWPTVPPRGNRRLSRQVRRPQRTSRFLGRAHRRVSFEPDLYNPHQGPNLPSDLGATRVKSWCSPRLPPALPQATVHPRRVWSC